MTEKQTKWIVIGVIILAIIGAGYLIATSSNSSEPIAVDISKVTVAGEPVVGQDAAPVTLAFWSDYQCIYCKGFETDVVSKIVSDYVDSGKVKIVFKDFAFLGNDSMTAALAGRAVWEVAPDTFYQWHKAMFEKQDDENKGWGNKEDVLALTKSLGIDADKVSQLMNSKAGEYQRAIDAGRTEGTLMGISGTPSIVIGDQLIFGVRPYDEIKSVIDAQLNK